MNFVKAEDLACTKRENCTPIRGGVTITSYLGISIHKTATSTLGFFATQTDGNSGFVTTNHSTHNNAGVR